MVTDGGIERVRDQRYEGWTTGLGAEVLAGSIDLATLADRAIADNLDPAPTSGRQEQLENVVNHHIWNVS
jgi:xylose isomerase